MNLEQLYTFIEVYRQKSFSKAADALYVPQSTISARLQQLEHETGTVLFVRNRNRIELTSEGRLFLPFVEQSLEILQRGLKVLQTQKKDYKETIYIGTRVSLLGQMVVSHFSQMREILPGIRFIFRRLPQYDVIGSLRKGLIDVGFNLGIGPEGELISQEVARYHLVAVVSAAHPYAAKKSITMEELAENFFILLQVEDMAEEIIRAFQKKELNLNVFLESDDVHTVKIAVIKNLGISILPDILLRDEEKEGKIVLLPIQEEPFQKNKIFMIYAADLLERRPVVRRLIEHLRYLDESDVR